MTIHELVSMAETIHDRENFNLGSASTREERNAFWARVIGCAHHGHPAYNPTPDAQWHLKKAGPSSPQSDDVAVSMPSRSFWDCIPGAGADGYRFEAMAGGQLPSPPQVIYPPPPPHYIGPPVVQPPAEVVPPYPGDAMFDSVGAALFADYAQAGQAPNALMGRWFGRVVYDWLAKVTPTLEASIGKHRAEWRAALGLPPL